MKSNSYQKEALEILRDIFGEQMVKNEWDSVTYDGHTHNHKAVYAPRHDIAVGPFNSYADLDIGNDRTSVMKSHLLTKKLYDGTLSNRGKLDEVWNNFPRCYLAIEIECNGSSKHMLGSIINASVSGSIGIVIVPEHRKEKARRICNYINRLRGMERLELYTYDNLIVFGQAEFLDFIKSFRHATKA